MGKLTYGQLCGGFGCGKTEGARSGGRIESKSTILVEKGVEGVHRRDRLCAWLLFEGDACVGIDPL
jgi:hypothetical protein